MLIPRFWEIFSDFWILISLKLQFQLLFGQLPRPVALDLFLSLFRPELWKFSSFNILLVDISACMNILIANQASEGISAYPIYIQNIVKPFFKKNRTMSKNLTSEGLFKT